MMLYVGPRDYEELHITKFTDASIVRGRVVGDSGGQTSISKALCEDECQFQVGPQNNKYNLKRNAVDTDAWLYAG